MRRWSILFVTIIILIGAIAYLVSIYSKPVGKIRGSQALQNADRNMKFTQIASQWTQPDLFSYGTDFYLRSEKEVSAMINSVRNHFLKFKNNTPIKEILAI